MHPPHEVAQQSKLDGSVQAARDHIRRVEVATECARVHERGEGADSLRGQRALVEERNASFAGRFAQRPQRGGRAPAVRLVS